MPLLASSRAASHRLLDGLSGHEPRGELRARPVAPDEVEDFLLLGEPEQTLSHY